MLECVDGRIAKDHILAEPSARNTAACIGYAAMEIVKKYGDGIMCIFPSDHFVKKEAAFKEILGEADQGGRGAGQADYDRHCAYLPVYRIWLYQI